MVSESSFLSKGDWDDLGKSLHLVQNHIFCYSRKNDSFPQLLIQLVAGLALLKVAATMVDLLATKLLPHKQLYSDLKYQHSHDFSDIRDIERRRGQKFETHEEVEKEMSSGSKTADSTADVEMSKAKPLSPSSGEITKAEIKPTEATGDDAVPQGPPSTTSSRRKKKKRSARRNASEIFDDFVEKVKK